MNFAASHLAFAYVKVQLSMYTQTHPLSPPSLPPSPSSLPYGHQVLFDDFLAVSLGHVKAHGAAEELLAQLRLQVEQVSASGNLAKERGEDVRKG